MNSESLYLPPEWSPQESVWLSWPYRSDQWEGDTQTLHRAFATIAATISRYQFVDINASAALHDGILEFIRCADGVIEKIRLYDHPTNDVWCRDHGPIFVFKNGERHITDWGFNGWGGKFKPYDLDNAIPRHISETLGIPLTDCGMILEGGSIEINGHGQLLTTEAVLSNPNRNPQLTKTEIEDKLRTHLGATDIFWLEKGIEGDDTDGHIDDLTRFVNNHTIITAIDPGGPNEKVLQDNLERLRTFTQPDGSPFTIKTVKLPQVCEAPGWRLPILPASYVNFLIINGAVLVPTFRQPENDQAALSVIAPLFPDRDILPIDCLDLVKEGGSLHCISQQMPAVLKQPLQ